MSRVFSKPVKKSLSKISPDKSDSLDVSRKLPKSVNTNPFTPLADSQIVGSRKRQFLRNFSSTLALKNIKKLDTFFGLVFDDCDPSPVKRIRVADFFVTRHAEEIASGEFGCVKRARHRLDGVDYAVKISNMDLVSRHDE